MNVDQVVQAVVDGVISGSQFGLLAIGFGLILGVTTRFHFAFATTMAVSLYVAITFIDAGLPLYVGIVLGIVAAALLGVLIEGVLYRPLARRAPNASLLAVFVTALAVVVSGENLIRLIWGSEGDALETGYEVKWVELTGTVGLTTLDLVTLGVVALLAVTGWLYLGRARYGRAIRAVQENPDMASAVGINPNVCYLLVFAVGSALSGVGAVLLAQHQGVTPDMGVTPTFVALVVVFLAGLRSSPLRFVAAGIVVGVIEKLSTVWIAPAWSPVVVFGILFVYIAVTPFIEGRRLPRLRFARVAGSARA